MSITARIANKDYIIYGTADTAAEEYAIEYGFRFNQLPIPGVAYQSGDVTGDGQLTSADALQIQRNVVKRSSVLDSADQKALAAADVTGDGEITSADALQIQRYVVKRGSVLDPDPA